MFDLVADVEKYPDFLPHCAALRVLSRQSVAGGEMLVAEMIVAYRAFREKFKSRVILDRSELGIDVDYLEGPFRKLRNMWRFSDIDEGCEIDFLIEFELRNFALQAAARIVFEKVFARMTDAFVARAHSVYG
jgi:coenzyme Q-binding protein COQ10